MPLWIKNKIISFTLSLIFFTLSACVSVSDKNQFLSNTSTHNHDLPSCEVVADISTPTKNTQGLNPDNIAFLNWNIYKGYGKNWKKDLSGFAKNHDVMTIQEAMLNEDLTTLLHMRGFNWVMNTAFHLNGTAAGVMNVANTNTIHDCGFKVKEPLIRIPKSTLVSYYRIKGSDEKLLVANIHSINFTLGVSYYRRQLNQLYDALKHHKGPMIVAGDFNSWSDSRMAVVDQLVEKLMLSRFEYLNSNKTHVFGNEIDHVFYRQLEPLNYQVKQVSSSDHNPISVRFKLRARSI